MHVPISLTHSDNVCIKVDMQVVVIVLVIHPWQSVTTPNVYVVKRWNMKESQFSHAC